MVLTDQEKLIIFHDAFVRFSFAEIRRCKDIISGAGAPNVPTMMEKVLSAASNSPVSGFIAFFPNAFYWIYKKAGEEAIRQSKVFNLGDDKIRGILSFAIKNNLDSFITILEQDKTIQEIEEYAALAKEKLFNALFYSAFKHRYNLFSNSLELTEEFVISSILCRSSFIPFKSDIFSNLPRIPNSMNELESKLPDFRLERLEKSLTQNQQIKSFVNMPKAVGCFVGRKTVLERIHTAFANNKKVVEVVGGLGGMGKTQATLKYIEEYQDEYNGRVRWFSAETPASLALSFRKFAGVLGIIIEKEDDEKIRKLVKSKLEEEVEQSLLVFDNVNDRELVELYLPRAARTNPHHTIITTRNIKEYDEHREYMGDDVIRLSPFSKEEAFKYIKIFISEATEEDALRLAELFDNIPLGLAHGVAYIKNHPSNIKDYIAKYQEARAKYSSSCYLDSRYESKDEFGHLENIYATVSVILEGLSLSVPKAVDLFKICSYLSADDIPVSLFKSMLNLQEEHDIISTLEGYSLISKQLRGNDKFIYIHRIVQEVIRKDIAGDEILKQAIYLVDSKMKAGIEPLVIMGNGALLIHAISLIDYHHQLKYDAFPELAHLVDKVGNYYEIIDHNYNLALNYYEKAKEIKDHIYEESSHLDIATSYTNIGRAYTKSGDNEGGIAYHELAAGIRESCNQEKEFAESLNYLGRANLAAGRPKKCLDLFTKSYEICKKLNLKDSAYADMLNHMGFIYERTGDMEKFYSFHKQALELRENLYPNQNHPSVALSLNNYGYSFYGIGQRQSGTVYLERSWAMYKELYGEKTHPDSARILNNLGYVYILSGKIKIGEEYQLLSLNMRKELFPKNHPAIAASLLKIGKAKNYLGKKEESLNYHKQALCMRCALFPNKDHPDIAESLCYVGNSLLRIGGIENIKLSLRCLDKSLTMMHVLYPPPEGHLLIGQYSGLLKLQFRSALYVIQNIANEVSEFSYSNSEIMLWNEVIKLWGGKSVYIIDGFIDGDGNIPQVVTAAEILGYLKSKDDLKIWFEIEDNAHKLLTSVSLETNNFPQTNIMLLSAFTVKELIEISPLIKYFLTKMLHLSEIPGFLDNEYLLFGVHFAVCNIGEFLITGSINFITPIKGTGLYVTRVIVNKYMAEQKQLAFQQVEDKSIDNPIKFIEKCGVDIIVQGLSSLLSGLIYGTPSIYNAVIGGSVGGMQCFHVYNSYNDSHFLQSQSIKEEIIEYMAAFTVGGLTAYNMQFDDSTVMSKMIAIKQGVVIFSSAVTAHYMSGVLISSVKELDFETLYNTNIIGDVYNYCYKAFGGEDHEL